MQQNSFICFGCQKRGEPVTPCTGLCLKGQCNRGCMPTKECKLLTKKYGHLTTMEIKCGCKEGDKCKVCAKHLERDKPEEVAMTEVDEKVKMCTCDTADPKPCTCGKDAKCSI